MCYVRVYVLPDDVGRKAIPRSSSSLRRALKVVMARVDSSVGAWLGESYSGELSDKKLSASAEDESMWYIFNTLRDPEPRVEEMKDLYGRKAMEELLAGSVGGEAETGQDLGVLGLKTPLYPYQRRSAAAMIQREVQPAQMLDPRLQAFCGPTGRVYYYDKEEGSIVREKRMYSEACGGILAETMGCGKTLISLAVIMATRGHFPRIPLEYQETENVVRQKTGSLVEMAAAAAGRFSLPWKAHFETERFYGSNYDRCIKACEEHRGSYIVPPPPARHTGRNGVAYPRPPPLHLRLSSGTLIIVPPNLVNHWQKEIAHHTEGLKVLVLRDSSDVTPQPDELLQYDIILFSRVRFEREAGEVVYNHRISNRPEDSPLTKLHWLRIVVDEGHNVAGHGQRTVMMHILAQLHFERRWVVSGTPSSGLYGVEVSLASHETNMSDTDLGEATTAVLRGRKNTGGALASELKDLDRLRLIVVEFLDVKPWSNSRANDPANWTKYIKPIGEDGKRKKAPSLRSTLQGIVVRHRMDTIHSEIPLPRLYNKVVRLEPTFFDRLNLNLFIFVIAVNAITSERKDQDYLWHPRNRKHLSLLISNLRAAGFWWAGSEADVPGTIDTALKYMEKNRDKMTEQDIVLLTDGVRIAQRAISSESWQAFRKYHELGVFIKGFPSHARSMWALNQAECDREPLLMGISQARDAQKFVTGHLDSFDPAEGLAGAGIKVRRKLAQRENNTSDTASTKKTTPDKPIKPKTSKKSYTKGLTKTLPPDSPLASTKLVATASAKLTYLLSQVLALHKAEKIIIFYDNNNSAFWIAEGLELLGIAFRIYASTLKPAQRAEYLELFRESEDIRVLLMDLRQASHGLHIANASRVFIINPIWQPNVESQAIKRAHRIGQTRPVFVETLVLQDTLEDKMLRRRKAMSDTEIQHAERDLLDDSTMSAIIQDEHFLPLPEDDSAGWALLTGDETPGLFDRHALPLPDDHDDKPTPKPKHVPKPKPKLPTPKRTRLPDAEPDLLTPLKRRRSANVRTHVSPAGIVMEGPPPAARIRSPAPQSSGAGTIVKDESMDTMANIIGISGPSSSGKTTLARLLQRIFNGVLDDTTTGQPPQNKQSLRTFIIHEDDFYKPDDRIPYTTTKTGQTIQDWDTASAIDIPLFTASLAYVRAHGSLPPRLTSIQDQNEVRESGVADDVVGRLRGDVRRRLLSALSTSSSEQQGGGRAGREGRKERVVVFLEGFLLYGSADEARVPMPMRDVHAHIDVGLFLPAPYDRVKERRESRTGYATIGAQPDVVPAVAEGGEQGGGEGKVHEGEELHEGEAYEPPQNFWTDPPGYVDDVVWPRYVRDHAWLLLPEGGEGRFTGEEGDEELVRRVGQGVDVRCDAGVVVAPGRGEKPMVEVLEWVVEEVVSYLLSSGGAN
ncbi:hypothetical protein P168DRAFT_256187 [Aspergillus campestris IBT 28561]|uniref:Helicase C-terminal domain-containing protein n=1 Tax=Aspergillus campestris (strain IBT 28561) TaxID=1392248 RepID=A0A2I1CYD3_ASPC2|nr:uncharacterized protein P168DRAFT_256187 [Aspergillus campestris IBT 28561]PKY02628.1 hypothetical protein P168DRAFT_256187 [Aspergillus campestris IBT 28561]